MARVVTLGQAKRFGLPGRNVLELMSGEKGSHAVTLRVVEVPVPKPGEALRGPHVHRHFEECMYVLSGKGETHADSGVYPLKEGDVILMPAGEVHVTRNTGPTPLILLCFFPAPDMMVGTEDVVQA